MIYYITGIDKTNGNEWVISSHDNAERATHYLENYRATSTDDNVAFRVDTVPSNDEIRERNATIPAPKFTAETPNGDFTLTELFGNRPQLPPMSAFGNNEWLICRECGALVGVPQRHLDFHNKLLP